MALFLFLAFSVEVSRAGHSVTSGPPEPLNWRGSLLVAGSKDRGLSPETTQTKGSFVIVQDGKALDQRVKRWEHNKYEVAVLCFLHRKTL